MRLPNPSYDWMDARVESYLDGGLPAEEQKAFEHALVGDADWEAELFLARQIRTGLRTLPQPTCPPHVTEAVLAQVRGEAQVSWIDRFHAWMAQQWTALWQPALAMTFLLLLVVSSSLIGKPPRHHTAEVQQALAEVQWTLAFLSEMGRQTGQAVRDDVIKERVVWPVQDALGSDHPSPNERQR